MLCVYKGNSLCPWDLDDDSAAIIAIAPRHKGRKSFLSNITNLEKTLISISVLLFITLVLVILFGITFKGSSTLEETETICWSKECIKTAGEMLSMMDSDTEPCSDFYSFACGEYRQRVSSSSVAQNSIDEFWAEMKRNLHSFNRNDSSDIRKVKNLYQTCMNTSSYPKDPGATLRTLMSEAGLGLWPALDIFWDESEETLEERLTVLTLLGIDAVFRLEIVPDLQKPGSYINKIYPAIPLSDTEEVKNSQNFKYYLKNVLILLGLPETKASMEVTDILSVEGYFNNVQKNVSCGSQNSITNLTAAESLSEMNRLMPGADWKVIMSRLWGALHLSGPFPIEIHCKEKIKDYIFHLGDLPLKTTYNYIGWRFFHLFSNQLGPEFLRLRLDYEVNEGRSVQLVHKAQWRHCLDLLERYVAPLLPEVLPKDEAGEQVEWMTLKLKNSFKKYIQSSTWLSEPLQERIKQKIDQVKFEVPSQNSSYVHHWLSQLEVDTSLFVRNIISLQKQMVRQSLQKYLAKDFGRHKDFDLTTPKKFYWQENSVGLYFDKLREPYLRKNQPSSLTYGGLGTFMSQQLSRFLLEQNLGASPYDNTFFWDLWANDRMASSFILDKFTEYVMADNNIKEILTKELFTDYVSLQTAYSAFLNDDEMERNLPGFEISKQQMFFLAYAQSFCEQKSSSVYIPLDKRINSALGTLSEFSVAFDCDRKAVKNPSESGNL